MDTQIVGCGRVRRCHLNQVLICYNGHPRIGFLPQSALVIGFHLKRFESSIPFADLLSNKMIFYYFIEYFFENFQPRL